LGLYGQHCSFMQVDSLASLPIPANVANLIVSQTALDAGLPMPAKELHRLAQPTCKVLVLRKAAAETKDAAAKLGRDLEAAGFAKVEAKSLAEAKLDQIAAVKGKVDGAASWTHMYGDATNAAYTGETLGGVKNVDGLEPVWLGRPGPRYQTDRQNRK